MEEKNSAKQENSAYSLQMFLVRVLRLGLLAVVVVVLTVLVVKNIFYLSSEQAVINAQIIGLRAPIIGELRLADGIRPGLSLPGGSVVFSVNNPRFGNLESFSQFNYLQNSIDVVSHELRQSTIARQLHLSNLNRMKKLVAEDGVSQKDFETAQNVLDLVNADIASLEEQKKNLQERFNITQAQLDLQKEAVVKTMDGGLIWAVLRKDGEYLNINDEVVQVIRPDDVWIEAFFSERCARKIHPGMFVTIRELGSKRKWQGSVLFVRSGVGRVSYNAPVAIPPQKLKERLLEVRIKVNWGAAFTPEEFYGVGRSVEVTACR